MKTTKNSNWARIRKFFNDIHLWVGLISGLFVFVICLSGTIYVYNDEIRAASLPHLHKVTPQPEKLRLEQLKAIVQAESQANITSINIASDPTKSYQIFTKTEGEKSRFGTGYYIDPYTGNILGTSKETNGTTEFMSSMFSLHRWLLLDKVEEPLIEGLENRKLGSYISGGMTILFTIGLITGMVIWFPRKIRAWRQGLTIKFSSNWKRINHDLHNSLAFYSLFFLLIMGITGPQWSFDWYRDGLRKTLGTYEAPKEKSAGAEGNQKAGGEGDRKARNEGDRKAGGEGGRKGADKAAEGDSAPEPINLLSADEYLAAANSTFPYTGDVRMALPAKAGDPVKISKYKAGFFAPAAADQASLNIQNASVEEVVIFRDKPFNERVSGSIKALHIGDVYGQFSKLLYFLTCLVATTLPVTGTLIWINKMKKKKKKKKSGRPVQRKPIVNHESI